MKDQKTNDMLNSIFENNHKMELAMKDNYKKKIDKYLEFEDIQDIKREMIQLVDYNFTDKTLEVHWILGNKIDVGTKVFDLDKFEDWVRDEYAELNDGEYVVWIYPSPAIPMREPMPYSMSLLDYTQENETDLVKEFFNKFK